ncbi:TetR family transcriptional regulator [Cellulomonas sp. APG4]|uniref:TetR/AcrR family transcriptional regulator n=1 Tax=Cellulomonas sp. APG4 TaxID=1538656 RepID=UPI00351B514D
MRSEDLTTRARIRDAAVRCFGRGGFRVGVRVVAKEAGVSPGLVLHHFGSKQGLREACDAHVLGVIREHKREAVGGAGAQALLMALASLDRFAPLVAYVLRSLQEGGSLARAFVDHLVEDTEAYLAEGVAAGTLRPSRDEAARARYLTHMGIGTLMVDLTLDPPEDPDDATAFLTRFYERTALPVLELFTDGLMTDRSMLDAYLLYVGDPPAEGTDADPPAA